MKLLFQHILSPDAAIVFDRLRKDKSIKVVHLWRIDLVQRYISEHIHTVRRLHYVRKGRGAQDSETLRTNLVPDEFFSKTNSVIATRNLLVKLFADHRSIHVTYEDLLGSRSTRSKLLDFLGIDSSAQAAFRVPEKKMSHPHAHIEVVIDDAETAILEMEKRIPSLEPLD